MRWSGLALGAAGYQLSPRRFMNRPVAVGEDALTVRYQVPMLIAGG